MSGTTSLHIDELKDEIETTVYVDLCIAHEWDHNVDVISVSTHNKSDIYSDSEDTRYVNIAQKKIKIKIPKFDINPNGELVKFYEEKKSVLMAEHEVMINQIQGKIDSLLAIEHKGEIE